MRKCEEDSVSITPKEGSEACGAWCPVRSMGDEMAAKKRSLTISRYGVDIRDEEPVKEYMMRAEVSEAPPAEGSCDARRAQQRWTKEKEPRMTDRGKKMMKPAEGKEEESRIHRLPCMSGANSAPPVEEEGVPVLSGRPLVVC